MIETKALTKRFDSFTALNSAAVHVPAGSVYGLVGPNGAGKTTLIRHIAGVLRPTSGSVWVGGQPVYENPAVKARMAHVPDDLYFFPGAGIRDTAAFYRRIYPRFDMERFEVLKSYFPLELNRPLRRFSKGMQKQAAIWMALCCRPDYILLDEPVDGLDPVIRRTVWSLLMYDVQQFGTTVFISSHNLRELEDVCNHVGIMHDGRVILERNLSELQQGVFKLQVAFPGKVPPEMAALPILKSITTGRVHEYILRGAQEELLPRVRAMNPLLAEALPLSLEEVFVYELGEASYVSDLTGLGLPALEYYSRAPGPHSAPRPVYPPPPACGPPPPPQYGATEIFHQASPAPPRNTGSDPPAPSWAATPVQNPNTALDKTDKKETESE